MFSRNRINSSRERAASARLPGGRLLLWMTISFGALLIAAAAIGGVDKDDGMVRAGGGSETPAGMVLVPGGEFVMGSESFYEDEKPAHGVMVNDFFLDRYEVTNAQFASFVKATGYITRAERDGHSWAYFEGGTEWQYAEGTDWRHPQGPGSTIENRADHPVVCVSWEDAAAFAAWAGKRLPTEAEWEYAARAGDPGHFVARTGGNPMSHQHHSAGGGVVPAVDRSPSSKSHAGGQHQQVPAGGAHLTEVTANIWDGEWPAYNRLDDGYFYTAPAGSFKANGVGVHDMLGNVWEWTADWYDASYFAVSPEDNPRGPQSGDKRVARGGSWFCSPNYCGAYSTHYRGASPPDHAFNNVGFRCARDVPAGVV
jgi:sulfatase modifying factor 1